MSSSEDRDDRGVTGRSMATDFEESSGRTRNLSRRGKRFPRMDGSDVYFPNSAHFPADNEVNDQVETVPTRPFLTKASQRWRDAFNQDCIRTCSLFEDRDPTFVNHLMEDFHVEVFVAGDVIIREGDIGDTMYFLRRGEVDVFVGKDPTPVRTLTDGSVIGELSLLGVSEKRTATVIARSFCDCRVISRRRFQHSLQCYPKEKTFFDQLTMERLRKFRGALEEKKRKRGRSKEARRTIAAEPFIKSKENCQKRQALTPFVFAHIPESDDDNVSTRPPSSDCFWSRSSSIISTAAIEPCFQKASSSPQPATNSRALPRIPSRTPGKTMLENLKKFCPQVTVKLPPPSRPASSRQRGDDEPDVLDHTGSLGFHRDCPQAQRLDAELLMGIAKDYDLRCVRSVEAYLS